MKSVSISGSPRANVGKKDAREMRRNGLVPCVIYGGKEQIHFSAPELAFKNLVYTPDANLVKLDVGGTSYNAILQDIQFHKLTNTIIHIDFLEMVQGKPLVMKLPIRFEGTAPGVRAGGKLIQKLRTLKVRALSENLPDNIIINIEKLDIGTTIKVGDIERKGLEFLDAPNVTIVTAQVTRNVVEEVKPGAPAAGAAAPAAAAPKAAPAAAAAAKPAAKK